MTRFSTTLSERLPALAAALWWGSLTAVGFLVVPLLFAHLPTAALAGQVAAKLFTAQTWLSVACTGVLLVLAKQRDTQTFAPWARDALAWVIAGMLLALLLEFGAAPRIVAKQNLQLWHSLGTLMYVLQWLCALRVLWCSCACKRSAA